MSYEQLKQHADEIVNTATRLQSLDESVGGGQSDNPAKRYPRILQEYQQLVYPLFEPYYDLPDPASYQEPIDRVRSAMHCVSNGQANDPMLGEKSGKRDTVAANRDLGLARTASKNLQNWRGAAADTFMENFLDPFPLVCKNQFILLSTLKGALEAHQKMWENARADIDQVAATYSRGAENLEAWCSKDGLNVAFSVASAVAAIAAVPLTGGASATVVATLSAVGTAGSAGVTGTSSSLKLAASSPEQAVHSMKTAVDKLTNEIRDTEGRIAKALDENVGAVQQDRSLPPNERAFSSGRPQLAEMHGRELTGDGGLGSAS